MIDLYEGPKKTIIMEGQSTGSFHHFAHNYLNKGCDIFQVLHIQKNKLKYSAFQYMIDLYGF